MMLPLLCYAIEVRAKLYVPQTWSGGYQGARCAAMFKAHIAQVAHFSVSLRHKPSTGSTARSAPHGELKHCSTRDGKQRADTPS